MTLLAGLSSTLEGFVGSVGVGDPKTCWLVDSGATCHIISEKWVKHYRVSFQYPGPSPSLKGAGDNELPVKGVVDLEFSVGKQKTTMKRVVVVGIPLNVISTYALLESGWKTVLGNAEESGLFLKKLKLPLKISERAWWLKVTLLKNKSGVKGSGPAPMDLSTVNTANTGSTKGKTWQTKQTKRSTDSGLTVSEVVTKADVAKDCDTKDSVTKAVSCQEVAQVRSKVRATGRELQLKSADMLQSFSYVCRVLHFGSSRLFQQFSFENEPNTNETYSETNSETSESDGFLSCDEFSEVGSDDFMSFGGDFDGNFEEDPTDHGTFLMMRGFPVEDLAQDDDDFIGSPSLANTEDLEEAFRNPSNQPHEPSLPPRPDTPVDLKGLTWRLKSQSWVMDISW